MSFRDRLVDDVRSVFCESGTHGEALVFVNQSIQANGVVEIESYNTGAGAENEVNRSLCKLCRIFVSDIKFPEIPQLYSEIYQPSNGITWTIKQISKEAGMFSFTCTAGDNRSRGRSR